MRDARGELQARGTGPGSAGGGPRFLGLLARGRGTALADPRRRPQLPGRPAGLGRAGPRRGARPGPGTPGAAAARGPGTRPFHARPHLGAGARARDAAANRWRPSAILLGYGAPVHLLPPPDDPLRALGAVRAELATLRHRAYLADEAVRSLRMNLVGLEASVTQARRSLESWPRAPKAPSPAGEAARQGGPGCSKVAERLSELPIAFRLRPLQGTLPQSGDPRQPGGRWWKRLLGRWWRGR